MTNNTEAVIKATTEYDLAVLPELVEALEVAKKHGWLEISRHEWLRIQSTLDRLKRRGE